MTIYPSHKLLLTVFFFLSILKGSFAFVDFKDNKGDYLKTLKKGFMTPPDSVRPGVYWYFMDGNISIKGMTEDLEEMKKASIGSVIFLEVNVGIPRRPVTFLSEEWQDLFKHAVKESDRLGISLTLGSGPGWTGSGTPELWNPLTGESRVISEFSSYGDYTAIPIRFEAHQSFFVVFNKEKQLLANARQSVKNSPSTRKFMDLDGPWKLSFDPKWGGPEEIQFEQLTDWTKRPEVARMAPRESTAQFPTINICFLRLLQKRVSFAKIRIIRACIYSY